MDENSLIDAIKALESRISLLEDYESALPQAKEDPQATEQTERGPYCCPWFNRRVTDGRVKSTEIECSTPYETQEGLLLRFCPSCGTKL